MVTKSEAKRARLISAEFNDDETILTLTVAGAGSIAIDQSKLAANILAAAAWHGLKQKVSDAAAIPLDAFGNAATAEDKLAAMRSVYENLLAGDWSKRGNGDGEAAIPGIIYRAFHEWVILTAKSRGAAIPDDMASRTRAMYDAKDRAGQLALRNIAATANVPSMREIMAGMAPAKKSSVDVGDMLADLGLA